MVAALAALALLAAACGPGDAPEPQSEPEPAPDAEPAPPSEPLDASDGLEVQPESEPPESEPPESEPPELEPPESEPPELEPRESEPPESEPPESEPRESEPADTGLEELASDPVLQWAEFDPGIRGAYGLRSVGNGLVQARLSDDSGDGPDRYVTTLNGTDWTEWELRPPAGIDPSLVNVDDEPWLVVGREVGWQEAGFPRTPPLVFVSSNEGGNWTEVAVDARPVIPHAVVSQYLGTVSSALVSGDRLMFSAEVNTSLGIQSLLVDRGLISPSQSAVVWEVRDDSLVVRVYDDPTVVEEQRTVVEPPDDVAEYTFEELALSPGQRELVQRPVLPPRERVRIFAGDASGLAPAAEYEGQGTGGVSTPDGFVLQVGQPLLGGGSSPLVSSSDGRNWSVIDEDPSGRARRRLAGVGADGAVWSWSTGDQGRGVIETHGHGEAPTAVTVLAGLTLDRHDSGMSVGPAGLALTATPSGAFQTLFGLDTFGSGTPIQLWIGAVETSIAKGRYELRFNEPRFGLTLWDSSGDVAVRVMEDALVGSLPQGVRESGHGEAYSVTLEDLETGDDLVTFTLEDLGFVSAVPRDETWVGWSTDGVDWEWQTAADAFGTDSASATIDLAVGDGFVLAHVDGDRWFIADASERRGP